MNVLFVHQGFPAQFKGLVKLLSRTPGVRLAAIGTRDDAYAYVDYRRYKPPGLRPDTGIVNEDATMRIGRAEAVVAQAKRLRSDGFEPDIVLAHTGWGEALLLRDTYPRARIVCYCEYYYRRTGGDLGFDPEFPSQSEETMHRLRVRNAFSLASMDDADLCISATAWQRSTYPAPFHDRIEVFHEGVDVGRLTGSRRAADAPFRAGLGIPPGAPVVSYSARYLEPLRGFHTFMRSLPALLQEMPDAHVLVVGSDEGGYGAPPKGARTWKEAMLKEVGSRLDAARVHFLGSLPYDGYCSVLGCADVHVYLTAPFVLSWSAVEAMAMGKAIVASATPPVTEFMTHGDNAWLVDFFRPEMVTAATVALLDDAAERERLGNSARATVERRSLDRNVASRNIWTRLQSLS
ncbi:glycosyltransferase [Pseudochelatococcus sp. B33]